MNVRPHIALDPASLPRPSAKVARVAELLDAEDSFVRRLISDGELEAHGKGKRGVRVYLDSVAAYQERQAKPVMSRRKPVIHKKEAASASTAAFRSAMAGLSAKGLA